MPANSAAAIKASEAGTLRIDRTASNTSGSRFTGLMLKISDELGQFDVLADEIVRDRRSRDAKDGEPDATR